MLPHLDEVVVLQLPQVVFPEISKRHRIVVSVLVPSVEILLDESVLLGEHLVQHALMRVQLRDRLLSDLAFGAGDHILEALENGFRFTPAVIAENIDKSRTHVSRRLSDLTDYGLVEKPKRGYYEITDLGRECLANEIDADNLERIDDQ